MKRSKQVPDSASIGSLLFNAQRKKKSSLKWILIYTILFAAGYYIWMKSNASFGGVGDYIALVGCIMFAVVMIIIAILIFSKLCNVQARSLDYMVVSSGNPLTDEAGWLFFFSFLGTALAIGLPIVIILTVIEEIEPLYRWLLTPVSSILRYRGLRLAGFVFAAFPYFFLWARFFRNVTKIPKLTRAYENILQLEEFEYQERLLAQEAARERSREEAARKSWEKTKEQRRTAEKRNADSTHVNRVDTENR